jgi:hypothetical protein
MAKAYTVTSDPFYINGSVTQSAADTYTQVQISAPLDSLNREGLLVHAVYFTSSNPDRVPAQTSDISMQVTTTSKTGIALANDANLLSRRELVCYGGVAEFSGPHVIDMITNTDSYSPEMTLGIVATDDLFLAINSNNQGAAKSCAVRIVASRIKLSADAYAALVTNELSS